MNHDQDNRDYDNRHQAFLALTAIYNIVNKIMIIKIMIDPTRHFCL